MSTNIKLIDDTISWYDWHSKMKSTHHRIRNSIVSDFNCTDYFLLDRTYLQSEHEPRICGVWTRHGLYGEDDPKPIKTF